MADFQTDISNSLKVLIKGGLILYPTDTIWGIGCDATNEAAVDAIYRLKQRPAEKSMIVLLAEKNEILKYIASPDPHIFKEIEKFIDPTTIVFESAIGLAENLLGKNRSVALRVCNDSFCKQLIKRLGHPLVSTSANLAGDSTPRIFDEINENIINGVDYVVKWRQDDKRAFKPSRVIKWNREGGMTVLRP